MANAFAVRAAALPADADLVFFAMGLLLLQVGWPQSSEDHDKCNPSCDCPLLQDVIAKGEFVTRPASACATPSILLIASCAALRMPKPSMPSRARAFACCCGAAWPRRCFASRRAR